jgi:superfamily I DNA and RNA helicase
MAPVWLERPDWLSVSRGTGGTGAHRPPAPVIARVRTLQNIQATAEQLPFISDITPGTMVIRGAAGSGKTTTAILRLNSLLRSYISRRQRQQEAEPIRALVLTYNRTLRGYIAKLVSRQRSAQRDRARR